MKTPTLATIALLILCVSDSAHADSVGQPKQQTKATPRRAPARAEPAVYTARHKQVLDVHMRLQNDKLSLVALKPRTLRKATRIKRYRGPFELSLWNGKQQLATYRFSMPLALAAPGPRDEDKVAIALSKGVTATATVRVPALPTATHLIIRDVRNGKIVAQKGLTKPAEVITSQSPLPAVPRQ